MAWIQVLIYQLFKWCDVEKTEFSTYSLPRSHSMEITVFLPIWFGYHMNSARQKSGRDRSYVRISGV